MTLGGWIFMLTSCGFVLWLTGYCFWKVLSKPSKPADGGVHPIPPV